MDTLILELYDKLKQTSIKNPQQSSYWIFQVDSVIVKENGVSKRYLKVLFFNRKMNETGQLMRLYLNVNGEHIEKDDFVMSAQYQNPNIMGFLLERDLIDESCDVQIEGYVVNGKKVELHGERIQGFSYVRDVQKFNVLKTLHLLVEDMILVPHMDEEKWICTCGYCNHIDDIICPICARKKEEAMQLIESTEKDLLLFHINEIIPLSMEKPIRKVIKEYITFISNEYNISKEELYEHVEVENLVLQQENQIDQYIQSYLGSKKINLKSQPNIHEAIRSACSSILNDVITLDKIEKHIDVDQLQKEFDDLQVTENIRKQKTRKYGIGITIVAVLLCIVLSVMKAINKEDTQYSSIHTTDGPLTILNTYENRSEYCPSSIHSLDYYNENIKSFVMENQYCPTTPEYTQYPKWKIEEIGNKTIRTLDDTHTWVKEVETNGDIEKEIYYVGDTSGNRLPTSKHEYYVEVEYADGKKIATTSYLDQEVYRKELYEYTTDVDYTVEVFEKGEWKGVYSYGDDRIVSAELFHPYATIEKSFARWYYTDDDSYSVEQYDMYTNKHIDTKYYEHGFPVRIEYEDTTTHLYYDTNGLLAKREIIMENNQDDNQIFIYDYDFENSVSTNVFYLDDTYGNYQLYSCEKVDYVVMDEQAIAINDELFFEDRIVFENTSNE